MDRTVVTKAFQIAALLQSGKSSRLLLERDWGFSASSAVKEALHSQLTERYAPTKVLGSHGQVAPSIALKRAGRSLYLWAKQLQTVSAGAIKAADKQLYAKANIDDIDELSALFGQDDINAMFPCEVRSGHHALYAAHRRQIDDDDDKLTGKEYYPGAASLNDMLLDLSTYFRCQETLQRGSGFQAFDAIIAKLLRENTASFWQGGWPEDLLASDTRWLKTITSEAIAGIPLRTNIWFFCKPNEINTRIWIEGTEADLEGFAYKTKVGSTPQVSLTAA